jgi:uncharacterized protein YxeA
MLMMMMMIIIIITTIIIIIIITITMCKETGVQLDKKLWYKHIPKSVETSQRGKITKCKLTEPFPTTRQTL